MILNMKKVKGKASPCQAADANKGKDACITFGKGERIGWKSSVPPEPPGETDKADCDKEDGHGDNSRR